MTLQERYNFIIDYFREHSPEAETELVYNNPYQLLISVVLSAQCTDKRVNLVTPQLFERFPDPAALASSSFDELFPYIKTISYPNNKTKHLLGLSRMLLKDFGGTIPESVDELQRLPGVGRKTANVIASVIYNQPRMAVDTHVFRVSKRLGIVDKEARTPLSVELQLYQYLPREIIYKAHHWLILHGRYICTARNPKCNNCGLRPVCAFYQAENSNETDMNL